MVDANCSGQELPYLMSATERASPTYPANCRWLRGGVAAAM